VYFLHPDGTLGEFKPTEGAFSYRQFDHPPGATLIGCRLRLHRRPQAEIQKDIKARLKQKKATQPLALASAGCVWKNPPGDAARPRRGRARVTGAAPMPPRGQDGRA